MQLQGGTDDNRDTTKYVSRVFGGLATDKTLGFRISTQIGDGFPNTLSQLKSRYRNKRLTSLTVAIKSLQDGYAGGNSLANGTIGLNNDVVPSNHWNNSMSLDSRWSFEPRKRLAFKATSARCSLPIGIDTPQELPLQIHVLETGENIVWDHSGYVHTHLSTDWFQFEVTSVSAMAWSFELVQKLGVKMLMKGNCPEPPTTFLGIYRS
ncbi:hypothetical protein EDC04DRAFT_2906060 [Pisolithus marmoratus]|nr:hypothetical protein EDC04DRAFT_2906060 [Pisolithus marmoratus]